MARSKLKPDEIAEMFRRFRKAEPEPKGELHSVNDFTFLVAVVLSAQATDAGVNKATRPLFAAVTTPQQMVALGEDRLRGVRYLVAGGDWARALYANADAIRQYELALATLDANTHLHVSFDVDFLDPEIAPGVGTTVPGGPTYREAQLCMEMIADTGAGMYACKASVDMFDLDKDDFVEQIQDIITVGDFYDLAAGGQIIFT